MTNAVAYLFSGQGTQRVGMGAWLFARFPAARQTLQEAEDVLRYPLGRLMLHGPAARLRSTACSQPALVTLSVALHRVLGDAPPPRICAGHSVGEYSALVAAGALEFAAAIELVAERGRLMEDAMARRAGGMIAVLGVSRRRLASQCAAAEGDGVLDLAAFNSPGQIVVSGAPESLARLKRRLTRRAIRYLPLRVSVPFHSRLLSAVEEPLRSRLERTPFRRQAIPVVSNLDGRLLRTHRALRHRLAEHVTRAVQWEESLQTLVREGIDTVVEVGPDRTLLGHVRRVAPGMRRYGTGSEEELERVRQELR